MMTSLIFTSEPNLIPSGSKTVAFDKNKIANKITQPNNDNSNGMHQQQLQHSDLSNNYLKLIKCLV